MEMLGKKILYVRNTFVTIKGISSPEKQLFKLRHDSHIILSIILYMCLLRYTYEYYPLIKHVEKLLLDTSTTFSFILTIFILFVISLSVTFGIVIKIEMSYFFVHIHYQIKILNILVKGLMNGMNDTNMIFFQQEIRRRLIRCIQLDNAIRRFI